MAAELCLDVAYVPSDDVVAREIEGELILVPLVAGIGDMEDALFTLNETGRAIWSRMDGQRTLKAVAEELCGEFEAPEGEIENDVAGLVDELFKRKILVQAPAS